jgi:glycosyltransferase involved in cell wall biosynthesis
MYKLYTYNSIPIEYSIVTPIFNQEDIIVKNIKSFIEMTRGNFEIILILDFCFDETEDRLLTFLDSYKNMNNSLVHIKIFKNYESLFETACDNLGFKHSEGTYCLEIQADMEMTEIGYNLELTKPFQLLSNVIAVSGRCTHAMFNTGVYGKHGINIEKSLKELQIQRNRFYQFETCNRGPLLINRKKLIELNYLDEEHYFLDDSDHDLMARAYIQKRYICGYVPIEFNSPFEFGSTRNKKEYSCVEFFINKQIKEELKGRCINELEKYRNIWVDQKVTIYDLN